MKTFLKIIENTTWYRQFIYGAILAAFFGGVTLFCGFSLVWAILQIILIAAVREHYNEHLDGSFNWRNFFFLLVPVIILYIVYHSI